MAEKHNRPPRRLVPASESTPSVDADLVLPRRDGAGTMDVDGFDSDASDLDILDPEVVDGELLNADPDALPESDWTPEMDPPRRRAGAGLPVVVGPTALARSGDLLSYYLAEVRRHPLLDPEQEKALAIRYADTGDREAAEQLVTANLRLVVKLAFQYHRQWSNVLDLIQEGNVGLVEALSRYDPYRGIRFSSYAQYWIRAMILRFLMDNYRMVRLGSTRHGRKLFFQLHKERERLTRELGARPSTKRLAEALDVPETEVIRVDQHMANPALSLHQPVGGEDGRPLGETVEDEEALDPEAAASNLELGAVVAEQLRAFAASIDDDRERAIWYRRLTAHEPASLSELGDEFSVSKERVRQIETRLKRRLKVWLTEALGDEIAFEFQVPEEE